MKLKILNSFWSKLVRRIPQVYAGRGPGAIAIMLAVTLAFGLPVKVVANSNGVTQICVVVPHFKDEYWLSVGYGLKNQADILGVELQVFESGGYDAVERQIELLNACVERNTDAILIGAVSADDPRLLKAVDQAAAKIPVLALVNALYSDDLSGAIGVDWSDMGKEVGYFLSQRHPATTAMVKAVIISGPPESGWSPLVESGIRATLKASSVKIVAVQSADTGLREQLREVETALRNYPDIDYIIGSAPAIEGAMGLVKRSGKNTPKLIATYISHSVRRGLQSGQVLAVPYDDPMAQGETGVIMAIDAINGLVNKGVVGPEISLIKLGDPEIDGIELSPAGFSPE